MYTPLSSYREILTQLKQFDIVFLEISTLKKRISSVVSGLEHIPDKFATMAQVELARKHMESHLEMQLESYVLRSELNEKLNDVKRDIAKHRDKMVLQTRESASLVSHAKNLEDKLAACALKSEVQRIDAQMERYVEHEDLKLFYNKILPEMKKFEETMMHYSTE